MYRDRLWLKGKNKVCNYKSNMIDERVLLERSGGFNSCLRLAGIGLTSRFFAIFRPGSENSSHVGDIRYGDEWYISSTQESLKNWINISIPVSTVWTSCFFLYNFHCRWLVDANDEKWERDEAADTYGKFYLILQAFQYGFMRGIKLPLVAVTYTKYRYRKIFLSQKPVN